MLHNFSRNAYRVGNNIFRAHCDDGDATEDYVPTLVEQADAAAEGKKPRIKTPMQFEMLKYSVGGGTVHTFDGFRCAVQKQLNLNTVVTHFFWLGSQATNGQQIYQYGLIMPYDDKSMTIKSDPNFNIEGEGKYPIKEGVVAKTTFNLTDDANVLNAELQLSDDHSTTDVQCSLTSMQSSITLGVMQAITPYLSLGGSGEYLFGKGVASTSWGGVYDNTDHCISALWDKNFQLAYMRRVNPGRVSLTSQLTVDESMNSDCALGAEFTMKQSKVHIGVDSKLIVKSTLETQLAPGVSLQFSAEALQMSDHYRFGYGIQMG